MRIFVDGSLVVKSSESDTSFAQTLLRAQKHARVVSKQVEANVLLRKADLYVSPKRFERLRLEIQKALDDRVNQLQMEMVGLLLGQTGPSSLIGQMGGRIPAYAPLNPDYVKAKMALAGLGVRRRRATYGGNRGRFRTVNYLRAYPGAALGYFVYGGTLVRSLKQTSSTLSRRVGPTKVTYNDSSLDFKSKLRGHKLLPDDRAAFRTVIGTFDIRILTKLSAFQLGSLLGFGANDNPDTDRSLAHTLFRGTVPYRLSGRQGVPGRPLLAPTLAFFAQKEAARTVNTVVAMEGPRIFYDRTNPKRPRKKR